MIARPARAGRLWAGRLAGAAALVAACALAAAAPAAAAERATRDAVDLYEGWHFQVAPYLWVPEVHGSVQVRQVSAPVNVDLGKTFNLIWNGELYALMGHFEAKNRGLSLFVDAIGGTARPQNDGDFARTKLTLNYSFIEFGPAYQVVSVPSAQPGGRPIEIDALVGGRYMYMYDSITSTGNQGRVRVKANATLDWVDPFVGGRFAVPLAGPIDLVFRGDIGGFDAGSSLAWNVISGFKAELPWHPGIARTSLYLVYKVLDFDYSTGSGLKKSTVSLDMRGPGLGVAFDF